jgi:predicted transcriptional regulator
LKEEQVKILKTMNEATSRMDLHVFAEAVNLEPNQAVEQVQELAKEGFLRKVGGGYGLTEKGKNALKIFTVLSDEKSFNFYVDIDKPLGFTANSLVEFYRSVKQVTTDSLEFHLYRGDFEKWLSEVAGDVELAEVIGKLRSGELKGEKLRKAILKAVNEKYGAGDLL